jgi:hypothetical protein
MLKDLKKIFIKEDEPETKVTTTNKVVSPPLSTDFGIDNTTPISNNLFQPQQVPNVNVLSSNENILKFQTIVEEILKENNLQGFDYHEFMLSINSMQNSGTPESVIYKLTFNSLSSVDSSLTKEHIITSANHYIDVLNKNKEGIFKEKMDEKYFKPSSLKKERAAELDNQVLKIQEQIVALQQQINSLNEEKNTVLYESLELQNKGTENINIFNMVVTSKIEEINKNIEKVQTYI